MIGKKINPNSRIYWEINFQWFVEPQYWKSAQANQTFALEWRPRRGCICCQNVRISLELQIQQYKVNICLQFLRLALCLHLVIIGKKCNFKCVIGWLHDYLKSKKSTFFEIFLTLRMAPLGLLHLNKFRKTLILAFEAISELSCQIACTFLQIFFGENWFHEFCTHFCGF